MLFEDPLNVLGMYLLAMPVAGFLFGVCSECCGDTPCLQFSDPLTIRVGTKVSWPSSTAAFDSDLNPVTLSAGVGEVLSIVDIGGFPYALVEYDDGGPQQAYILVSDLTKEIDDWWEVCSGSWSIVGSILESGSSGTMTFLITEPTPYGIFTAEMYWVAGVEYIIYVRKGDDADDECGAVDQTIKFVPTGNTGEWKVFADGVLQDEIFETQGSSFSRNGVCVDEKGVTVIVNEGRVYQVCTVPGQYYFAIGASAAGTEWTNFEYSDHYDHNPNCPRCQPPCCFQNFSDTIEGFDITISGVDDGQDCNCPEEVEFYFPLTVNGICLCEQIVNDEIAFPGGAGQCDVSDLALSLVCDTNAIDLSVTLTPSSGTGVEWTFSFDPDSAPEEIAATAELTASPGDPFICDFSNATITITPRIVTGCCGGNPLP